MVLQAIEDHEETDPEDDFDNETTIRSVIPTKEHPAEQLYEPTRRLRKLHGNWTHPRTGVLSLYAHVTEIKEDLDYALYHSSDQDYKDYIGTNQRFPFVTTSLLLALTGVFVFQMQQSNWMFESFRQNPFFGPSSETMITLGAVYPPAIVEGHNYHSILIAVGLHGGILHILVYLPLLYKVGAVMEQAGNRMVLVFLFLWTGVCANIAAATIGEPFIAHFGSSGSLCGWFGYCCIDGMLHLHLVTDYPKAKVLFWVVVELTILFLVGLLPFVDNTMHIFGFLSGVLTGMVLLPTRSLTTRQCNCFWQWNRSGLAAAVLFGLVSTFLLYLMNAETVSDLPCRQCHRFVSCVIWPSLYCDPCLAASVTHDYKFGDDLLHCPYDEIVRFVDPVQDIVEACRDECVF